MTSCAQHVALVFLLQSDGASAVSGESSQAQAILTTIDQVLCGLALLLAACAAVYWAVPPRRDPLRDAPLRPNRLREDMLLLAVFGYLIAAAVLQWFVELMTGEEENILNMMLVGSGAQLVGIGICLVVAARAFDGGIRSFWAGREGLREHPSIATAAILTLAAVGLCPLVRDFTVAVILLVAPDHQFDAHPTIQALHDASQPLGIHAALWLGAFAVAPVAEEFFFRGLVQTLFTNLLRSRWMAIWLSALAFGAVHFTQPHAVPALVFLGILLGYAYERSGSLVPPILIHAAFNLKTLIWDAMYG